MKSNVSIFSLTDHAFGVISKNSSPSSKSQRFSLLKLYHHPHTSFLMVLLYFSLELVWVVFQAEGTAGARAREWESMKHTVWMARARARRWRITHFMLRALRNTKQGVDGIRSLWTEWCDWENGGKVGPLWTCWVRGPLGYLSGATGPGVGGVPRLWTEMQESTSRRKLRPVSGCFYPEREQGSGPQDTLGKVLPRPAASESPGRLVKNIAPLLN